MNNPRDMLHPCVFCKKIHDDWSDEIEKSMTIVALTIGWVGSRKCAYSTYVLRWMVATKASFAQPGDLLLAGKMNESYSTVKILAARWGYPVPEKLRKA